MDKIRKLRLRHAELSASLLALFRKHEFLRVERWADPEGVADTEAAALIIDVADLLDTERYPEPEVRLLQVGDIFAKRGGDERYLILGFMGQTAKVLDLHDFQERLITIIKDRKYVVWSHIKEDDDGQAEAGWGGWSG